jgi:hypothetical protein
MADTTTTTSFPSARHAHTFCATFRSFSTSATELPPYFCTITVISSRTLAQGAMFVAAQTDEALCTQRLAQYNEFQRGL